MLFILPIDSKLIDIFIPTDSAKIERRSRKVFYHKHATGAAVIELHEVAVERGMSWDEAKGLVTHCKSPDEGFYLTNWDSKKQDKVAVFLAVADSSVKTFSKQVFRIYRPNTGLQSKTETASVLKDTTSFKKVPAEEAESCWIRIYEESHKKCSHEIRSGKCSRRSTGLLCDVGLRQRVYHILSGSILSLWEMIEKTLPSQMTANKLQMARMKTADGQRVIGKPLLSFDHLYSLSLIVCSGTLVPEKAVPLLTAALSDKPPAAAAIKSETKSSTGQQGTSLLAKTPSPPPPTVTDTKPGPALSVPIFNTSILD